MYILISEFWKWRFYNKYANAIVQCSQSTNVFALTQVFICHTLSHHWVLFPVMFVWTKKCTQSILILFFYSALQFYIRLGCQQQAPNQQNHPILLQFSTDGGITWITMETMAFDESSNSPVYVALEIPFQARTNATLVRWWQPSRQGRFLDEWAIDQVCE